MTIDPTSSIFREKQVWGLCESQFQGASRVLRIG